MTLVIQVMAAGLLVRPSARRSRLMVRVLQRDVKSDSRDCFVLRGERAAAGEMGGGMGGVCGMEEGGYQAK